jgi:hypothetical protein
MLRWAGKCRSIGELRKGFFRISPARSCAFFNPCEDEIHVVSEGLRPLLLSFERMIKKRRGSINMKQKLIAICSTFALAASFQASAATAYIAGWNAKGGKAWNQIAVGGTGRNWGVFRRVGGGGGPPPFSERDTAFNNSQWVQPTNKSDKAGGMSAFANEMTDVQSKDGEYFGVANNVNKSPSAGRVRAAHAKYDAHFDNNDTGHDAVASMNECWTSCDPSLIKRGTQESCYGACVIGMNFVAAPATGNPCPDRNCSADSACKKN